MAGRFASFVMLAGMRTGSNFLEENLRDFEGLTCHGEVFNPVFIGKAGQIEMCGVSLAQREADPFSLLERLREQSPGLWGFRFFPGHDPRILDHVLTDPTCAKIVLRRNPVESYVSRKIAAATGQWRLGDMAKAKTAQVSFDEEGYLRHLQEEREFHAQIRHALQTSGQAVFHLDYSEIGDLDILNGIAAFLGLSERKTQITTRTKKQNPAPLRERVTNPEEMGVILARIHAPDDGPSDTEPARGPMVPGYVAAARAPVLFLPMPGGPRPLGWLAALDGVTDEDLQRGFTQKTLRRWRRENPGHRSFTVLRHPVPRLFVAFRTTFLSAPEGTHDDLHAYLKRQFGMERPGSEDREALRDSFLRFARFVRGNLAGQTGIRINPLWASQSVLLQGISQVQAPDLVLREEEMAEGLGFLATRMGLTAPDATPEPTDPLLDAIYDKNVEAAVKAACRRDYLGFGFTAWR
ncbi:MAG: nodulation protein NodH [Rhodobacteraceae bacterium]|nr:nodulation protein NodH [Paracoccaceae bacterium]